MIIIYIFFKKKREKKENIVMKVLFLDLYLCDQKLFYALINGKPI